MRPIPSSGWQLPDARSLPAGQDYAGSGMDWESSTLLNAYAQGYFPMPRDLERDAIDWWSPDPRAVFDPRGVEPSRSLRQSIRRYRVTLNTVFEDVVTGCADPTRPSRWIDSNVRIAYHELHALQWAHSIEVWSGDELVGGLYGVEIGGLFAGESMFHRTRDASKVALIALAQVLAAAPGARRIDSQWMTPHLRSLGALEVSRADYIEQLPRFLASDEVLATMEPGGITVRA